MEILMKIFGMKLVQTPWIINQDELFSFFLILSVSV